MDVSKKVPVKHVTLFSNGVSIVERQGSLPVKEGILYSLDLDLDDLNNVLRTIMVIDLDGGAVKKIQYEISGDGFGPTDSGLQIDSNKALTSIIKGSVNEETKIVTKKGEEITGRILGSETNGHLIITNDSVERTDELILLTEEGSIIRLPMNEVDQIIPSKNVIKKIRQSQTPNKAKATIGWELDPGSDGKENHNLIIRYLQRLEKWDMIYHIHELNGKFILYGFGVLTNPTTEDWKDVSIDLELATAPESQTQIYPSKINIKEANKAETPLTKQNLISYKYNISEPLNIPKMSSVLIPIIQETVEGIREYFWNTSESKPTLFLKITNTKDLAWAPGSVVYWEKAQFTSEGRIEFTPVNEETRIRIGYTNDLIVKKEQEKVELNEKETSEGYTKKYVTKFRVENTRPEPVILWVKDKPPEDTKPEIINATHSPKKDTEDHPIWLLSLNPKEKKEVSIEYAYK
ncbi:MAG: DUF4139 domain-containing protein [Candidatus Jordarchaeaceae archaeon]